MDKTLKKEKDCQKQLDKEVHVQWSDGHFTFDNSLVTGKLMSLMLADHHHDSRDHKIQKAKICSVSVCGERPGSVQFTVSGEEAAQSECRSVKKLRNTAFCIP